MLRRLVLCSLLLAASSGFAGAQENGAPLKAPIPKANALIDRSAPVEASPLDEAFSAFASSVDLGLKERFFPTIPAVPPMPGREALLPLVRKAAEDAGVPLDLADAIIAIDSRYDPAFRGAIDEIGLMQVTPAMARRFGFSGTANELEQPETNIRLGMQHLADSWRQAGQDVCHTLLKYRNGLPATDMTDAATAYCRRVLTYLAAIDSTIGRAVALPGLDRPEPGAPRRPRFDWQGHEARMRSIDKKWGGENFGIIAP